ncbi:MAG: caspase family protein [Bacteroidetes bacterium]|nr:MAG: caspase family protein [Bacteroidota bacterium]
MKTQLIIVLLLVCAYPLYTQPSRGAHPVPSPFLSVTSSNTYAVVVGISEYQNLPDLQFADKDAETFANYLISPAGGQVPAEQIKLLLNEQATEGAVATALYWLLEKCEKGDKAVIYFSCHGDLEEELLHQMGFLLCYNAPKHCYLAGGCIRLAELQAIVNTLTLRNQSQVLVIADACHSGKLAGSGTNGPGKIVANLAQVFANAMLILACQPNETSLESAKWTGGLFTRRLIDGLCGDADTDQNGLVKLGELAQYLAAHVPEDAAPNKQNPIVTGDRETVISKVVLQDAPIPSATMMPVILTGSELVVLAQAPYELQYAYEAFNRALDHGQLLEAPHGHPCANDWFNQMIQEPCLEGLRGHIKRTFVAALIDQAQGLAQERLQSKSCKQTPCNRYPKYMARAAAILGEQHLLYNDLKRKEYAYNLLVRLNCL